MSSLFSMLFERCSLLPKVPVTDTTYLGHSILRMERGAKPFLPGLIAFDACNRHQK